MMQFFGTNIFPVGMVCVVNVIGCPAEKDIQPFEPTQNCVYVLPKKQKLKPMLKGPCCVSSPMNKLVPVLVWAT
jgi:hypothetical protein